MKQGLEKTEDLIEQNDLTIVALKAQEVQMADQAKATNDQIKQNRELFVLNIQPVLTITGALLDKPINSRSNPIARLVITNSGQSVANDVRVTFATVIVRGEGIKRMENGKMPGTIYRYRKNIGIIGASRIGKFETVPNKKWNDGEMCDTLITGDFMFYIFGQIVYFDIFKNGYICNFCLRAEDVKSRMLEFNSTFNQIGQLAKPDYSKLFNSPQQINKESNS